MSDTDIERRSLELDLLLEGVYRRYGFDFREYARSSLLRRVERMVSREDLATISGLQERVFHDPECMERLLLELSINTSSFFRDPEFYKGIREKIVPMLRTYPFVRVWCAGCSRGEEVYSMAILFREEGLYDRTRIYATDMNECVLQKAKQAVFPLRNMQEYTRNYQKCGGTADFSEYYSARYENAVFSSSLRDNIVFSRHNLVTDSIFNEFNLIMCRNVMIYFGRDLQERVHRLLYDSLPVYGFLGLGKGESIQFTPYDSCYEEIIPENRMYRKIR